MRIALVLALLPALALADPPPVPPEGHPHLVLHTGEAAPSDGIFADKLAAQYDYERLRWLEAERLACRDVAQKQGESAVIWPWVVGGTVGAVVGVVVAGAILVWKR